MLKNIQLHLESDEHKQVELEEKYSQVFAQNSSDNINAFKRYMPSLVEFITHAESRSVSLFINKFGCPNVVDYGTGRVLYGFRPEEECVRQVHQFIQYPLTVDCHKQNSVDDSSDAIREQLDTYLSREPVSERVEIIVMLGLGLGLHLLELLKKSACKHLIIYEPETQYFSCSASTIKWREIFDYAKKHEIGIYLQLGKDGRNLIDDMEELRAHTGLDCFYLYKHYNHPVFDSIQTALQKSSWSYLQKQGIHFSLSYNSDEYRVPFCPPIDKACLDVVDKKTTLFDNNIAAFNKYFPNIAKEFSEYQPRIWYPALSADAEVNLIHKSSLDTMYAEHPKQESEVQFGHYAQNPHKDGLVLGYTGTKLKHYLHYQFVNESESLLEELQEVEGKLDNNIKSIILFGLGSGYQLEAMSRQHKIEKLFLCEPNRDFFYASLYAIDWHAILTKIDKEKGRIYINIGDDGTNLFRDLLNQFYAIGPYTLAHTYFYQGYYNTSLNNAIGQLREQLQVVISMGEYFDHAYFGINHTVDGISRGYSHMVKNPQKMFTIDQLDTPVFIVGNGPSLDTTIDEIVELQTRAIIVSCGTALQVLHRRGIVPDFHTEIEQNRSTHDWALRLQDREYLKKITLVSCNGIHPDTCDLYKDVLIAFKEGESSTVSSLNLLGESGFESLKFAFPTVSNFAVNLFVILGFKQLYFFGIDLGFVDKHHHHSKSSGYYDEKGIALYDYSEKNNTGLVVPGNFVASVNTKHEFKVSRMVMEDLLRGYKGDCFNTSNGAKINGASPLKAEFLLVVSTEEQKAETITATKTRAFKAFSGDQQSSYIEKFYAKYSNAQLEKELSLLIKKLDKKITTQKQADALIEAQKNLLFMSYKSGSSLLFYYLYGTTNYANALFSKILSYNQQDDFLKFNQAREIWLKHLGKMSARINQRERHFDITSSLAYLREKALIIRSHFKYVVACADDRFVNAFDVLFKQYDLVNKVIYINPHEWDSESNVKVDACDVFFGVGRDPSNKFQEIASKFDCKSALVIRDCETGFDLNKETFPTLLYHDDFLEANSPWNTNLVHITNLAILYAGMSEKIRVLLPKYSVVNKSDIEKYINEEVNEDTLVYDFGRILALANQPIEGDELLTGASTRGIMLVPPYLHSEYVAAYLTKAQQEQNKQQVLDAYPFLKVANNV